MFTQREAAAFDRWITAGPDERFSPFDCEDCGEHIRDQDDWDDHLCAHKCAECAGDGSKWDLVMLTKVRCVACDGTGEAGTDA